MHALPRGRIFLPDVLGYLPAQGILITRAAAETATPLGAAPDDVAAAAEVLAVLHHADVHTTHVHTVRDELQTACRWIRVLRLLGEEHHLRLRELVVGLAESAKTIHEPCTTVIHRDLHPAQVLRSKDRLWLTDLDTLCRGHAELDLATFMAHAVLDTLPSAASSDAPIEQVARFLDLYRLGGGSLSTSRLRFYLPCAMARVGAMRLARGASIDLVERFWQLAGDCRRGVWSL